MWGTGWTPGVQPVSRRDWAGGPLAVGANPDSSQTFTSGDIRVKGTGGRSLRENSSQNRVSSKDSHPK